MYRTDYDPQTINNLLIAGMFILLVAIAIIVSAMQQHPGPVGAATFTSPAQISMDRTRH